MTPLTVLHAAQPTEAGVAGYVVGVAADQLARGWRVTVACPAGGQLATALAERGIPRVDWPATRSPGLHTVSETRRLLADLPKPWLAPYLNLVAGHRKLCASAMDGDAAR